MQSRGWVRDPCRCQVLDRLGGGGKRRCPFFMRDYITWVYHKLSLLLTHTHTHLTICCIIPTMMLHYAFCWGSMLCGCGCNQLGWPYGGAPRLSLDLTSTLKSVCSPLLPPCPHFIYNFIQALNKDIRAVEGLISTCVLGPSVIFI